MKQLKIIGLILALNLTGQVFGADAEAHIPEDLQLNVIKPGATNYAKHLVSGNRNYDPFREIRAACYQENFPVPVTIQYIVNEYDRLYSDKFDFMQIFSKQFYRDIFNFKDTPPYPERIDAHAYDDPYFAQTEVQILDIYLQSWHATFLHFFNREMSQEEVIIILASEGYQEAIAELMGEEVVEPVVQQHNYDDDGYVSGV